MPDRLRPKHWPRASYDPRYDPLVDRGPGHNREYAPTYWIGSAGQPPEDDGPVFQDMDVDVAVIGSGYTGLSCAIHLAKDHGIKATVLEANTIAWGCSTRNGGQAHFSSGRLRRSQWIKRWGMDVAMKMHAEFTEAFDLFRDLVNSDDIDCDAHHGGHFYIAHKPSVMKDLEQQTELLNEIFGYRTRLLSREELHSNHVKDQEAAGALLEPDGSSLHPAKLAFGYQSLARKLGATIHPASPVMGWKVVKGVHHLTTPGGTVRARAVAIATGGYTPPGLNSKTKKRLMPILSNSVVTRPLTDEEYEECGFKTLLPLTDSRTLRHYYRVLPDRRVQIGGRSAITGQDAENPKHMDLLLRGLYRKFPALEDVDIDYSWWGWVDVSHDMMPRIFQPDPKLKICYSLGYGGNGVMYSAQAGRRMAQMLAGKGEELDLPIFSSQLPSHGILTPFRRIGQRIMYVVYHIQDEML